MHPPRFELAIMSLLSANQLFSIVGPALHITGVRRLEKKKKRMRLKISIYSKKPSRQASAYTNAPQEFVRKKKRHLENSKGSDIDLMGARLLG